jgi:uncharacterized membrane protein YkoI
MKIVKALAAILVTLVAAPALQAQEVVVQVKEQKAGLLAQATVKPDSARTIALAQVPGGKITEFEIEDEHGKLVYEFKIAGQDGNREIYVDAKTGEVVTFEHAEGYDAMGAGIRENEPGLLAQATVKPDSAEKIALASVPGGQVVKRAIEREDGKLVYRFDITVAGQPDKKEVKVDALTGALVEVKKE